jgi:hypothetical protein
VRFVIFAPDSRREPSPPSGRKSTQPTVQILEASSEIEERRLDLAERNIHRALHSDDRRERLAASMFTVRNSHRARRRGWITSATSAAELSVSVAADKPQEITFSWRNQDGSRYEPGTDTFERDGRTFAAPRYGASDDPIDGELATPPVLIEAPPSEPEAEPIPEPPPLPIWRGVCGPPPLIQHLYAPWEPPPPKVQPQREREPESSPSSSHYRPSRGGYR